MRFTIYSLLILLSTTVGTRASEFSLVSMLNQVSKAISRADTQIGSENGLPPVDHIILKLNTETKVSASGKVSFWIVSVGASEAASTLTTMKMRLVPSEEKEEKISDLDEIAKRLTSAILAGAELKRTASLQTPPLEVDSYEVRIAFAISGDVETGFKLVFPTASASAGGSIASNELQEITIVFQE